MYRLTPSMVAAAKAVVTATKVIKELAKALNDISNHDPHIKRVRHLVTHSKKRRVRKKNRKRLTKLLKEGLKNGRKHKN